SLYSAQLLCSSLFPYTTLFRSPLAPRRVTGGIQQGKERAQCGGRVADQGHFDGVPHADGAAVDVDLHRARLAVLRQELRVREVRSEEHTSELQSRENLVCRLLL